MPTQTPFFQAYLALNTGTTGSPVWKILACQPGARLSNPENYVVPPIVGNSYQWNYGLGMRQASVDVNFIVRDVAESGSELSPIGPTLMAMFFNRTPPGTSYDFDTTIIPGITYWDGATGWNLAYAKAESFTLSVSKGDPVVVSCRFIGIPADTTDIPIPSPSAPGFEYWSGAPLMMFNAVNFPALTYAPYGALGAGLWCLPWNFSLSYSNNHTPNLALNNTLYPAAYNAGIPTAGFSLRVQANDDVSAVGSASVFIAGSNIATAFLLPNILDNTPDDRSVTAPRVFREHSYTCLGAAGRDSAGGQNNAPLLCVTGAAATLTAGAGTLTGTLASE